MKLTTKKTFLKRITLTVGSLPVIVSNALAVDGQLEPANTGDIVNNLGFFSGLGEFILEYAIHIVVFAMVACTVVIYGKGLYARANKKINEALEERDNMKGLVVDSVLVMLALIVLFNVVVPYISGFVPK